MHSPSAPASEPVSQSMAPARLRRLDDVVYQIFTVGAILLILGSIWLF